MFKILFAKSAEKEILNLPFSDIDKILAKIENLAHKPYPAGAKNSLEIIIFGEFEQETIESFIPYLKMN